MTVSFSIFISALVKQIYVREDNSGKAGIDLSVRLIVSRIGLRRTSTESLSRSVYAEQPCTNWLCPLQQHL